MHYCPLCKCDLQLKGVDHKSRLACISIDCDFVYWDNPVPVVAAIVEQDGMVVLARNSLWEKDKFALITGFLERDETPEQALLREIEEELGVKGEIVRLVGHYSFFEKNQLLLVFHVKILGEIVLSEELSEIKRISPDELKPWPRGTGPAVRDWLSFRKSKNI